METNGGCEVIQLSLFDELDAVKPEALDIEDLIPEYRNELQSAFDAMEIAEDEIAQAMLLYPESRYLIYGAFMTLLPQFSMPAKLYRKHCKELLARVAQGLELNHPTEAELLGTLMHVSWILPMHNEPSAFYAKLFAALFPEDVFEQLEMLNERYIGETDNLRAELETKLKIHRWIPVERTPFAELLEIEQREGHESGWGHEQNVLQIRMAREVNL